MSTHSIVFIDSRIADYEALIAGFSAGIRWHVLDAQQDGVAQIERLLAGESDLDAIHIISHGAPGTLYLGNTVLNSANQSSYQTQWKAIGQNLSEAGDILLYGCNVADGVVGQSFIAKLFQMTNANVAASADLSGPTSQGGDSELETNIGSINAISLSIAGLSETLKSNTAPTFTMSDGKLDSDFGSGDYGVSVIQQANGKLVVAGDSYGHFALARYNADGTFDTSFDGDGRLITYFGGSVYERSVIQQADGKLVAAGGSEGNFAVARYNLDGTLDTSFDGDGKLIMDFGGADYARSVIQQADGKLLVAGHKANSDGNNFALARYNADGTLDTSFDGDGKLVTDFGGEDYAYSVIQQADGKLVVAGSSKGNFAVVRYNADGTLDTSFDGDGKLVTDFGGEDYAYSVIQQADGKLVVAGHNNGDFGLARYNADGTLDTSFDGDGKLVTDFGGYDRAGSVIQQADGKLVVAGDNNGDFALARYNADGTLDTSFDGDGKLVTDFGGYERAWSVIQQTDGKLVLAGLSDGNFALARYNVNGTLDTAFSAPENTLQQSGAALFTEGNNNSPSILAPEAQILDAELFSAGAYAGATLTLARQGGADPQDVFFNSGSMTALTPGSYLAVDYITIGRVTANGNGILVLSFNSNATQSLVNRAMQQIAYINTSDAPPSVVAINWTFNDGNTGVQGTGGPLSVTGTSYVTIKPTNDAPYLVGPVPDQRIEINKPFSYQVPAGTFIDPDLETLIYSLSMADGTGLPPWLTFNQKTRTFTGIPGPEDVGSINLRIWASDVAGIGVSDTVRLTVVQTEALPDRFFTLGSEFLFSFDATIFTNVDDDNLIYGATLSNGEGLPSWLSFDPDTRTFRGTPSTEDVGALSIQVTAGGETVNFILEIREFNKPIIDTSQTSIYSAAASQYILRFDPTSQTLLITDPAPERKEIRQFTDAKRIEFADLTLNLAVSDLADTIAEPALNRIAELYVAFFNRVPDGDGMEFWLGQYRQGKTINDIADAFYNAGVYFSDLTGYRADMSNDDFIHIVYRNVLGRPEGADQEGLAFWRAELDSGRSAKGTLVSSILDAAHGSTFSDPTNSYHWVQKLLDNKLEVAKQVSVDWGVNYNSSEDSIAKGQAIAAAITPDDTSMAISLVGVVVADME